MSTINKKTQESRVPLEQLGKIFNQYFEVARATDPLLLDEALRLRYQVYCVENSYEQQECFPDGREFDAYDLVSVHSFIRHRATEALAANVRLILPRFGERAFHFPVQEFVSAELVESVCDWNEDYLFKTAEISRFCVSREFKHRVEEKSAHGGLAHQLEFPLGSRDDLHMVSNMEKVSKNSYHMLNGRALPHITLGVFAAIVQMSAEECLEYWFALMEPSLLKLLGRFGIEFVPIGDPIDYRGLRQPCFGRIDDVLGGIWQKRPDIWQFITQNGKIWPQPASQELAISSSATG